MYVINAETIGEAHEKVVRLIMGSDDFLDVTTEDKELTFEYPVPVNIHVAQPGIAPRVSSALQFREGAMLEYVDQMLNYRQLIDRPGAPDFSYLYGNLVWDYPKGTEFNSIRDGSRKLIRVDWPLGNGRGTGINQIEYVVNKLTASPTSRRCVVSLFNPNGHPQMDDPPCLNHIQFLLRNGEVNTHALFRSNDMLSAWGANAYALWCLQRWVVNALNIKQIEKGVAANEIKIGWMETTSISAHIYWKRDRHELDKFRQMWC